MIKVPAIQMQQFGVQYYEQCRQAHDLPSIPRAVIISCDEP